MKYKVENTRGITRTRMQSILFTWECLSVKETVILLWLETKGYFIYIIANIIPRNLRSHLEDPSLFRET
jgi:hypothetical protein